jgi:hypothetical protein
MAKDKLHTFVVTAKLDDVRRLMNAYGTTDADELFGALIRFELQRLRFRPQLAESDDDSSNASKK